MHIRKISLANYGAYYKKHEFDTSTTDQKSIIIIGGLNGSGKTTLFESVMLCLYGDGGKSRKAYEQRLKDLMYKPQGAHMVNVDDDTSVEIEFTIHSNGVTTEYAIERKWHTSGSANISNAKIVEELHIRKRKVDKQSKYKELEIDRDQWQAFVNGLIPLGVADLFFFDGEKISKMAEDTEDTVIKVSFNSLLGLDMVDKLQTDLQTNLARSLGNSTGKDAQIKKEHDVLIAQKSTEETRNGRLQENKIEKEAEMQRLHSEKNTIESKVEERGGGFAQKRQELKNLLAIQRESIEGVSKKLVEVCSAELPLATIPDHMYELETQIISDRKSLLEDVKVEASTYTASRIMDAAAPKLNKKNLEVISKIISQSILKSKNAQIVLDFSDKQQDVILSTIKNSTRAKNMTRGLAQKYSETREKISKLEVALASAPLDDEIGPWISKMNQIYQEKGRLESEIDFIEEQISISESKIKHISRKIKTILDTEYKNEKNKRMAKLTKTIQNILEIYAKRLRKQKIKLLEKYISESIVILMHKDLIKKVTINPESFAITLYDTGNTEIPRQILSSGEKQMLATAVLWGLAKTSGRPLPFMIDTPLARLDIKHRNILVETFLPAASHQTIVFSTDSEIRKEEYDALTEDIAKAYVIQYDKNTNGTHAKPGYFWDKNEIQ